jgi:hypothetical protein
MSLPDRDLDPKSAAGGAALVDRRPFWSTILP